MVLKIQKIPFNFWSKMAYMIKIKRKPRKKCQYQLICCKSRWLSLFILLVVA